MYRETTPRRIAPPGHPVLTARDTGTARRIARPGEVPVPAV